MRRNILLTGVIALLLTLTGSHGADATSLSAAARIDQVSVEPDEARPTAFFSDVTQSIREIPEPATLLLLGTGLAAAARFFQRKRRSL